MAKIIKVPHSGFVALTTTEFESSPTCDERIVCLNSQEVTIIRKAIEPFYWPTRYGEFVTPGYFQIAPNSTLIEALEGLETKMGCNDLSNSILSLGASLEKGLLAIANKPCCNDFTEVTVNLNGGINGSLEDGTITYGTTPFVDYPQSPPDGYTDQNHFDGQLCARANALLDGILHALLILCGATSLNAVAATVLIAISALGVITLPEVMIPTLISAMAVAYLAGGSLYAVRLELIKRRQDFVCLMVSGNNMGVVIEGVSELIDICIAAASVTGPTASAIKTILLVFFSADSLNWLLSKFGGTNYPDADCSDCDDLDCPVQLYFLSDLATESLATLTNCAWSDQTVVGTTGAWSNPVVFELRGDDLSALIGKEVIRGGVRLRMTVYLPENAQTQYSYGCDDQYVQYLSGNNGWGAQTYYIDYTFTGSTAVTSLFFAGEGNTRQFVLSDIKIDIPCESLVDS